MSQELREKSIEVILGGQAPSGAYVASPMYHTYDYCWFRDGSFVAVAMDSVGHHESSGRFHGWAADAILARREIVDRLEADGPDPSLVLDTRYRLDGGVGEEEWPNFQLDGFGTWLWSLQHHMEATGEREGRWAEAASIVARYLSLLWDKPCYDCWEEFPDEVHPHTLGTIHAGLRAAQFITGLDHTSVTEAIRAKIVSEGMAKGRLVKFVGNDQPDASLIGLGVPYGVFEPDDPVMERTVAAIERQLMAGGGVHRYPTDTFYGGGQWILLTCWLAWHYRELNNWERHRELLDWVEKRADENLWLPEQVSEDVNDPTYIEEWVERWGPVANPLLWSHAMYLLASDN